MSKITLISESRKELLLSLLKDERLTRNILVNGEVAKSIVVNDDGSVTIGRAKTHWWNYLFLETRELSFLDVSVNILAALSQYAIPGTALLEGLSKEIFKSLIEERRNCDYIIDVLVDVARIGVTEGRMKSLYFTTQDTKKAQETQAFKNNERIETRFRRIGKGMAHADIGGAIIPVLDVYIEEQR